MTSASGLLEQASDVLQRAAPHSNRAACWITRAALERAVDDLLEARRLSAAAASMRSKLIVLQVAFEQDGDLAALADHAWTRLSRACHHHAFELAPSATEVQHLMEMVTRVSQAAVHLPAAASRT